MRARKQIRKWVNRMRRKWGKKNGVIGRWAFDFAGRGPWSDRREKKPRYKQIELDS